MKLVLRKSAIFPSKGNGKKILFIILWYIFAWGMIGYFNAPKAIVYLGDLINFGTFINAIYYKRNHKNIDISMMFMGVFIFIGILSALRNLESPLLLFWGLRNNVRFFLFYYTCTIFLTERHFQYFLKIIKILFWLSLPLCIYEKYFVTYDYGTIIGDMVGGIYYGFQGVTPPFNILLVIYCTHIAIKYFDKKCGILSFIITISSAMTMAAMAELKIFVVEIVIIFLIVMIIKKKSIKTVFISATGIFAISLLVTMFVHMNGQGKDYYTAEIFSIKGMFEIVTRDSGYDGVGDLNRFSGISVLKQRYMKDDPIIKLIGLGLGNGEYARFSFFTSDFYVNYSSLHYQWFSSLFVFLETGFLGLISYLMIFVSGMIQGVRKLHRLSIDFTFYFVMVTIMLIMIFYGVTMRSEQSGFILYMILALPVALEREKKRSDNYDS